MSLAQLLQTFTHTDNSVTVDVPEAWLQGRSAFGGLQAVIGVKAMRQLIADDIPLRTLQTTFLAPVPPGKVTATAEILRAGKNATHVKAEITRDGAPLALFIGVFGKPRESAISRNIEQPAVNDQTPIDFVHIPGVTPNFTAHFDSRWLEGGLPFTGQTSPMAVTEISMRDSCNTSESHLLAIADFIPPAALSLLKSPSFGSSLTWMLEFLSDDYTDQPLQKWRVDSEMTAANGGYTSQTATIYAPNGDAIALSRQSMVIFA